VGKRIAIEKTARSSRAASMPIPWLVSGDRLEIVVAVGGG
jgi:hypothetical protein